MIQRLRESTHWKSPQSPRKKKARMTKSKFKAMMIVFFDIRGVIYIGWVPESQTVNQVYYKNVLTTLHERVRRRPDMWKNASWILHHDSAPAYNALSVKRYLVKNNIPVMEHPPYSPDLAPCDFFLFPKIKSALKGTRFESVDAVKAKATQLLNSLTQDDLQHCFQKWKICMEQCGDRGGDYIEGDNISIVWFFFNKGLEHESGFFIATPRICVFVNYIIMHYFCVIVHIFYNSVLFVCSELIIVFYHRFLSF